MELIPDQNSSVGTLVSEEQRHEAYKNLRFTAKQSSAEVDLRPPSQNHAIQPQFMNKVAERRYQFATK
jgi:hypothetical protein